MNQGRHVKEGMLTSGFLRFSLSRIRHSNRLGKSSLGYTGCSLGRKDTGNGEGMRPCREPDLASRRRTELGKAQCPERTSIMCHQSAWTKLTPCLDSTQKAESLVTSEERGTRGPTSLLFRSRVSTTRRPPSTTSERLVMIAGVASKRNLARRLRKRDNVGLESTEFRGKTGKRQETTNCLLAAHCGRYDHGQPY